MIPETLITLFLFALNPVINKYMLKYISVKGLVLITGITYFFIAGILIFILYDRQLETDFKTVYLNGNTWLILLMLSFPLIHIITHYFYYSLIHDYKTYFVTAIVASYPLFTAILGYLVLGETITVMHLIGILLIVSGISVLNLTR